MMPHTEVAILDTHDSFKNPISNTRLKDSITNKGFTADGFNPS